jgi:AcrR family transcriptional regulator
MVHEELLPDIAAEAGLSVGAPHRYFASKEAIILEIAGDAFRVMFDPVERFVGQRADRTGSRSRSAGGDGPAARFVLQDTAFGLDDPAGFTRDVRVVLSDAGLLRDDR